MTLVITRLTPFGIAMAADSALTIHTPPSRYRIVPSAVTKLRILNGLNAGVSCWGRGQINGQDTDLWLQSFIGENTQWPSIEIFANRLASRLNQAFGSRLDGQPSIGFHVAGYEVGGSEPGQVFYHVHDGPSDFFRDANPHIVNCHRDCSPTDLASLFRDGRMQEMRNGEFRPYAVIRRALGQAFQTLGEQGLPSIELRSLADVEKYNVLEMRLMTGIYGLFRKPVVGGHISSLLLTQGSSPLMTEQANEGGASQECEFEHVETSSLPTFGESSNPDAISVVGTSNTGASGWNAGMGPSSGL